MFLCQVFKANLWVCFTFALLATRFGAIGRHLYVPNTRTCGTNPPSQQLRDSHAWLHANEPMDNKLWNSSSLKQHHFFQGQHAHVHSHEKHPHSTRQSSSYVYIVDTYIHIVADSNSSSPNSSSYITDAMIQNQFSYLQRAYTNTSIGYRLVSFDRTTNDTWATNGDDTNMKRALRKGTYSSLNIYYQSQLQAAPGTPGIPSGSTLLGYCSLPAAGITTNTPTSAYIIDGCNVLSGTVPGGTMFGYNQGGTTAHEVGHWNGLLHTFNDNTCNPSDFGDYVADTPQEMTSTSGCPASKDSCPNSGVAQGYNGGPGQGNNPYGPQGYSGPDPIHNFMDYSNDACYQGFTAGQGARMLNIWQIYRQGL